MFALLVLGCRTGIATAPVLNLKKPRGTGAPTVRTATATEMQHRCNYKFMRCTA
jgi:hypothetical protein